MNIKEHIPIVLYDDQCYICTKFAGIVNSLSRGNITIIGHYSKKGEEIRNQVLDNSALNMFWFIDEKFAYGGRAALIPLIQSIITLKDKRTNKMKSDIICEQECKTVKSVFIRSASLLSNSKKIVLK